MAAHVARRKEGLEVNMLVRDSFVCQSINENHHNWYFIALLSNKCLSNSLHRDNVDDFELCFLLSVSIFLSTSYLRM